MSNGPWTIYVCPTTDDPYTCRCDRDGDCDDRMFYVMPVPDDAAVERAAGYVRWCEAHDQDVTRDEFLAYLMGSGDEPKVSHPQRMTPPAWRWCSMCDAWGDHHTDRHLE